MSPLIHRLLRDDSGQDMIEYALLTVFFGIAGMAALQALEVTIGDTYEALNTNNNDLWATPDPLPETEP